MGLYWADVAAVGAFLANRYARDTGMGFAVTASSERALGDCVSITVINALMALEGYMPRNGNIG